MKGEQNKLLSLDGDASCLLDLLIVEASGESMPRRLRELALQLEAALGKLHQSRTKSDH